VLSSISYTPSLAWVRAYERFLVGAGQKCELLRFAQRGGHSFGCLLSNLNTVASHAFCMGMSLTRVWRSYAMAPNQFLTRPLYLQLRDALAERIAKGEWKPSTAIPSEGDLAREFGVSPGTMRKALDLMEGERLVTRRQGRGTFVNDQAAHELAIRFSNIRGANGERIALQVESAEATKGIANKLECLRLRLQMHDLVYRIRCVRLHEDQPLMVEEASMPAALFPGLVENNGFPHDIVILAQQHGMLLGKAQERISIDAASPPVAEALRVAPSSPIMVLDRVMLTLDGRRIEWRIGRCHLRAHHYLAGCR
jgi:GntR family transcriptional regulator